jgi:hypothetical protein
MYFEWRYGVYSHRGRVMMVALGEWEKVEWAMVVMCSLERRMHSWSYSGFAMLFPCHVCGSLLPLNEKMTPSGYSEWYVWESKDLFRGSE